MGEFVRVNGAAMGHALEELKKIQEQLREAYNGADNVKRAISSGAWEGKAQVAMQAYMELMIQYHKRLIGLDCDDPVQQAIDGFQLLTDRLDEFYTQSKRYIELEQL